MAEKQGRIQIEDGYGLTEAEIDKRIAECDLLFPVHHEGIPAPRATLIVMDIIKHIERAGAKVLHAHRYKQDGITNLLVKAPPGMTASRAVNLLSQVVNRIHGVKGINTG